MNILILGSFDEGALENAYVAGFRQLDCRLTLFDITKEYNDYLASSLFNRVAYKLRPSIAYQPVNTSLEKFLGRSKYDAILVFKGLTLLSDTVKRLKEHTNQLCCYNADHPTQYFSPGSGNTNILKSIPYFDFYFTYSRSIVEDLRRNYQVNAFWIPFGYSLRPMQGVCTEEAYFLMAGAYDLNRAQVLSDTQANDILIFGDNHWRTRTIFKPRIKRLFQGRKLYGEELQKRVIECRGVVNILRAQNMVEHSHNMRTFEVPGMGGLLISNFTSEQAAFFEPDKEALYYRSIGELREILEKLRRDEQLAIRIKTAAKRRCLAEEYSYDDRARQMYNILDGRPSSNG